MSAVPEFKPAAGRRDTSAPLLRAGVLVGGAGRRMGRPKHLLRLDAESPTFVECVCRAARSVAGDVVLLGQAADLPDELRALRRLDDPPTAGGPLAGLAALLRDIIATSPSGGWGLLLACDLPRLGPAPLQRLWQAVEGGRSAHYDAAAFEAAPGGRLEACCALYHTRTLDVVIRELAGRRSLQGVLAAARTLRLAPTAAEQAMLTDVDTPADLGP